MGGSWDVRASLPLVSVDSLVGPVGFNVVGKSSALENILYVLYTPSTSGDESGGLQVAYAIDSAAGLSPWQLAGLSSEVESVYLPPRDKILTMRYDRACLEIKPEFQVSDYLFTGLGCVYVDEDDRLYLSETVGGGLNAQWERLFIGGGYRYSDKLDEGGIVWVKMIYFEKDLGGGVTELKPYFLYAKREFVGWSTEQVPRPQYICKVLLWVPADY
jgi:hypothetical protein